MTTTLRVNAEGRRKNAERGIAPVQPAVFILHSTFYILHSPSPLLYEMAITPTTPVSHRRTGELVDDRLRLVGGPTRVAGPDPSARQVHQARRQFCPGAEDGDPGHEAGGEYRRDACG